MTREDIDVSGYSLHWRKRPGLSELMKLAEAGKFTKLLVYKLSRLSRRVRQFHELVDRLESMGVAVVSVTELIDTSTPTGRLLRNILVDFAEFYSDDLSSWIVDNQLTMVKQGRWFGAKPPYGLRNNKEQKRLVTDAETFPILLEIFTMGAKGWSRAAVARLLNSRKIPPPSGKGLWRPDTVGYIWRNPVYRGYVLYNGEKYDGAHDSVIPSEVAAALDDRIASEAFHGPGERGTVHPYARLLRCGYCGSPLVVDYQGSRSLRRYVCRARRRIRECQLMAADADTLDDAITRTIVEMARAHKLWDRVKRELRAQADRAISDEEETERRTLQARLRTLDRIIEEIGRDYYEDRAIPRDQFLATSERYAREKETVLARITELDYRRSSAQQSLEEVDRALQHLKQIEQEWRSLSPEDQRVGAHEVIRSVVIVNERATVDFFWTDRPLPVVHLGRYGRTLHF